MHMLHAHAVSRVEVYPAHAGGFVCFFDVPLDHVPLNVLTKLADAVWSTNYALPTELVARPTGSMDDCHQVTTL